MRVAPATRGTHLRRGYDAQGQYHGRGTGARDLLESRVHQVEYGGNDGSNRHRVRTYSGDSPEGFPDVCVLWRRENLETFCIH